MKEGFVECPAALDIGNCAERFGRGALLPPIEFHSVDLN